MDIVFDELEADPGGRESRRGSRVIAAVGAVSIVLVAVAAVTGYAIGRSSVDADDAAGSDPAESAAEGDGDAAATHELGTAGETDPDAEDDGSEEESGEWSMVESAASVSTAFGGSGGMGYSAYGDQPTELLAERTTSDGFVLRAHLGNVRDSMPMPVGPGGWMPQPWCFESGQLRVALGGNGVTDVGFVGWYREPYQGRAVSYVLLGVPDGQPHWVVVAQVAPDASSVSVTFPDGSGDSATPQNGVALLSVPTEMPDAVTMDGASYYDIELPEFEVRIDGGSSAGVVESGGMMPWSDPEFRAACTPSPPALPEPGVQPDDPAAAEQAITEAMAGLYTLDPESQRELYVDDPTGIDAAAAAISGGEMADQVKGARPAIEELVFTTPSEAWFRYQIVASNGQTLLSDQFGVAVLVDGAWKITRDTVCQDFARAGGDCGNWQPVMLPSSFGFDLEDGSADVGLTE